MRTIQFIATDYSPWEMISEQKECNLADFIEAVPYLMLSRVIPSREAINEVLQRGEFGGGMSPGAKWDSFQMTQDEYDEVVRYWFRAEGNSALGWKSAEKYVLDKEITCEKTHLGYGTKCAQKYRKKGRNCT